MRRARLAPGRDLARRDAVLGRHRQGVPICGVGDDDELSVDPARGRHRPVDAHVHARAHRRRTPPGAILIDGSFIASVVLDQAPTTFSTAAEDYSVDGDTYPSYDWTFSGASPSFVHAPTGKLPYDTFTGTGWHSSM